MVDGSVSRRRLVACRIGPIAGDNLVGRYHDIQLVIVGSIHGHIICEPNIIVSRNQVVIQCSKAGHATTEAGRTPNRVVVAESPGTSTE